MRFLKGFGPFVSGHNKVVCSSRENFTKKINGSRVRAGGTDGMGGYLPSQILAAQLTLFRPVGQIMPTNLLTPSPRILKTFRRLCGSRGHADATKKDQSFSRFHHNL